jgi:hypothetical protein
MSRGKTFNTPARMADLPDCDIEQEEVFGMSSTSTRRACALLAAIAFGTIAAQTSSAADQPPSAVEQRILHIQDGLLPAVIVKGEPVARHSTPMWASTADRAWFSRSRAKETNSSFNWPASRDSRSFRRASADFS